jgi:hypothetical protein
MPDKPIKEDHGNRHNTDCGSQHREVPFVGRLANQRAETNGRVLPSDLELPNDLRAAVQSHLDARRVLGASLEVRAPRYAEVTVSVTLRVVDATDAYIVAAVAREAQAALYQYLSPYTGGPDGQGWPIGRDLHVSEIYARMQRLRAVEYVEEVRVTIDDPDKPGTQIEVSPRLVLNADSVLCSGVHEVQVV